MKYRKLVLGSTTVNIIKDHLNNMTADGIVMFERAQGDIKPTSKKVRFQSFHYKRNRPVGFDKNFPEHGLEPYIFIHCEGFSLYGREVFNFGDVFYLGDNVVLTSSKEPSALTKQIVTTRITLLSKSDEPSAMKRYREWIRHMINRTFICNEWDRPPVTEEDIDQHIAFLDQHKGKEVKNPAYPYVCDPWDGWEPSC